MSCRQCKFYQPNELTPGIGRCVNPESPDSIHQAGIGAVVLPHHSCEFYVIYLRPGERFEKWIPAKEESHRTMDEDYIKRELEKLPVIIECRFGIQYADWDQVQKDLQELLRKNISLMDEDMRKQKWQVRLKYWFVNKLEALADKLSA